MLAPSTPDALNTSLNPVRGSASLYRSYQRVGSNPLVGATVVNGIFSVVPGPALSGFRSAFTDENRRPVRPFAVVSCAGRSLRCQTRQRGPFVRKVEGPVPGKERAVKKEQKSPAATAGHPVVPRRQKTDRLFRQTGLSRTRRKRFFQASRLADATDSQPGRENSTMRRACPAARASTVFRKKRSLQKGENGLNGFSVRPSVCFSIPVHSVSLPYFSAVTGIIRFTNAGCLADGKDALQEKQT